MASLAYQDDRTYGDVLKVFGQSSVVAKMIEGQTALIEFEEKKSTNCSGFPMRRKEQKATCCICVMEQSQEFERR